MDDEQLERLRDLEVMKDMDLTPKQAELVEGYFVKKALYAGNQRRIWIGCAIMVASYVITNLLPDPLPDSPFERMMAWLFNVVPILIATLAAFSIGFWQFVSARLDRAICSIGLPPGKAGQIAQLGNAMSRVRIWGKWAL